MGVTSQCHPLTAVVEKGSDAAPQASAKWRIMWRMAPRLLERWSEAGRLNAINAAVTTSVKKVCVPRASKQQPYGEF
jgi:hypothetical protein